MLKLQKYNFTEEDARAWHTFFTLFFLSIGFTPQNFVAAFKKHANEHCAEMAPSFRRAVRDIVGTLILAWVLSLGLALLLLSCFLF